MILKLLLQLSTRIEFGCSSVKWILVRRGHVASFLTPCCCTLVRIVLGALLLLLVSFFSNFPRQHTPFRHRKIRYQRSFLPFIVRFAARLIMAFHLSSVLFLCLILVAIAHAWHTTPSSCLSHRSASSSLRLHPDQAPELEAWASQLMQQKSQQPTRYRHASPINHNDDDNHQHRQHHGNSPFRLLASGTMTGPVAWCWRKLSSRQSSSSSSFQLKP